MFIPCVSLLSVSLWLSLLDQQVVLRLMGVIQPNCKLVCDITSPDIEFFTDPPDRESLALFKEQSILSQQYAIPQTDILGKQYIIMKCSVHLSHVTNKADIKLFRIPEIVRWRLVNSL